MTGTDVYERLREFLDTLPAGYPATPTGVEIRILKKLFSPEEAELTMKLSRDPEPVSVVAARIGTDPVELAGTLEAMAQKGLIFRVRSGEGPLYQAFQFVVGIYEFQLKTLDREFCEMFEEYLPYLGAGMMAIKTRQIRIIPVEASVRGAKSVAPYNRVRELVEKQDLISVSPCICRMEQGLLGNPCDRPKESCLGFGNFAQYYLDNHMARKISREEALKLLDQAEKNSLVLSPVNTRELEAICCCCPCCCPNLKFTKLLPRPADIMQTDYEARIDPDLCTGCGDCMEKCQMEAIREGEGVSEVVDGRCIGCGLCVPVCPTEAISLLPRAGRDVPPADLPDLLARMTSERSGAGSG
jgi:Na+-translocating ferredoxin:NAD+ oxidoreductase subunit B